MLPGPSRLPDVVDALIAATQRALPGVQVFDGPSTTEADADTISIGLSDGETVAGYSSTVTRAPGMGKRRVEDFTISCWLSSWTGDSDDGAVKARRDRAAEMLAAIGAALHDDEELQQVADKLELGQELNWLPVQSDRGAACGIAFDITGRTFL